MPSVDQVRVRFAPSPTGYLHVGGARTALYNWLFARHHGGRFVLRIEDTDRTRYKPDALSDLLEGLRWLGWQWDEGPEVGGDYGPYYQSDRQHLYQQYADQLIADGRAYRCYCSSERLTALREQQRADKLAPGYDRHCRHLTQKQIQDYEAQGIQPVVRLAIPSDGASEFDDVLRGHISVDYRQLDDLILLKSDGYPTYHLANVVDDHLMAITHIMRGEEWLSTVPKHVLLYDAFGWQMPVQAHLPTILDPSGKGKLSKRKKKTADGQEMLTYVHEFRQAGYLPEAMNNFLALVGWSLDGETEFLTRDQLIKNFSLERVSKAPSAFAYDKLEHMNATYIRGLGANDLAGRLMTIYRGAGMTPDIQTILKVVPLVQERLKTLQDVVELTDFLFVSQLDYDPARLIQKKMDRDSTLAALQASIIAMGAMDTFDEKALDPFLRAQCAELGLKARQYFGILRIATSGKQVAPPLFGSLEILGQDETLRRLQSAVERLQSS